MRAAITICIVVASWNGILWGGCQVPGPQDILNRLRTLENRQDGVHKLKSGLRAVWLHDNKSHTYLRHLTQQDKLESHEVRVLYDSALWCSTKDMFGVIG